MASEEGEIGYPYLRLAGGDIHVFLPDGVYAVGRRTIADRADTAAAPADLPAFVSPFGRTYALRRVLGAGEHAAYCRLFLFDSLRSLVADPADALELVDYALRTFAAMLRATLPTPVGGVDVETAVLPADAAQIAEIADAFPDDESLDGAEDGLESWLADAIAEATAAAPPQPTHHLLLLGRFHRLVPTPSLRPAPGELAVLAPNGGSWRRETADEDLRRQIHEWWGATRAEILRAHDRARLRVPSSPPERPGRRELRDRLLRTGRIETSRLVLINVPRQGIPPGAECYVGWRMPAHVCRSLDDRSSLTDGELAVCSPLEMLPRLPQPTELALFRRDAPSGAWRRVWARSGLCPGQIEHVGTSGDPRVRLVAHLQAVAERFFVNGRMHEHD